jgi:RNA polymerase sigma factor (sigma-70 family)
MSSDPPQGSVLRYLQAQVGGLTDGELLDRYARQRDEAAFAAVVRRYGGLVLGVARRHLADRQQAEDVFQATFLALARSAERVGRRAPLAGWLYTVTLRQARKERARSARRRGREQARAVPPAPPPDPLEEITGRELLTVVDEELARLPEQDRLAVLLCWVQGLSREEAARRLGWSAGAVKGRLERGRRRLAARLAGRGLAPSALVLAPVAGGTVPAELLARTTALGAAPWSRAVPEAVRALAASAGPRRCLPALVLFCSLAVAGLTGLALTSGEKEAPTVVPPPPPPAAQAPAPPPDDPLPAGSTLRFGTARYRQGTEIRNFAVSADGTVAVTGSEGHIHDAVRVFDLTTGRVRYTVAAAPGSFNENVGLSPDGKTLATAEEKKILLRDAATGKELRVLSPPTANPRSLPRWLLFAPDGQTMAITTPDAKGVHLLDLTKGTVVRTFPHKHWLFAAAFSPDGKVLAAGGYDHEGGPYFGRLWEVATGKELRRFVSGKGGLRTLAFAPDGKTLAGGCGGGRLRLWDVATGKEQRTFPPDGPSIRSVAFAPDGKTVAAAGDSVRLYDPATGKERLRIERKAVGLHFSADGKVLTGAVSGAIYRWDPATGRPLTPQAAGDSAVEQILVTPDGRRVVTRGQDGGAHLWDGRTGAHLRRIQARWQHGIALSPDGKHLVWPVVDESVKFRDPQQPGAIHTGSRLRLYDLDAGRFLDHFPGFQGDARTLAFAADGKTLVTVDHRDGTVRLWDVDSGKEQRNFRAVREAQAKTPHHVWHAALSPDGRTLAVTYQPAGRGLLSGFAVLLWDVATGKETHELPGHFTYVGGLAFSPDSRLLVTGSEPLPEFFQKRLNRPANQVFVWEVATGKRVRALPNGLPTGATRVAFAPDGRTVATANPDGTIQVWEAPTWKVRVEFRGHRDRVTALAFAPDGRLLSGGLEATVLAWDVRPRPKGGR